MHSDFICCEKSALERDSTYVEHTLSTLLVESDS